MDMAAESNAEEPSSAAEDAAGRISPESTGGEAGRSEASAPPVAESNASHEVAAARTDGAGSKAGALEGRLELLPLAASKEGAPRIENPAARHSRNFTLSGLAAGVAMFMLIGAGVVYESRSQTSALAARMRENEHLVSTVSNLGERLDLIEAARAREETADMRKVLGEIKQGASATRDVSAAVAQLASRVDHIEREQSARLDKLAERLDHDASSRVADITARLDKLEKKAAAPAVVPAAAAPPKPAAPDVGAAVAQLTSRLDHIEQDQGVRLDKLAERLEHDSSSRFGELAARMDKLEKNPSVASAASSKPASGAARPDEVVSNETTGSIEKPKPPLRGYAVVGVGEGFAVIEGREGAIQVAPGDSIPGLGRVLRIERHGREWNVVTSLGVIGGEGAPY
jgi:hypothetical protein